MSMRYLGGFITASYNPLKVPNAPTIGTVTAGNAQVSVEFTAPANVGGSAITSYTVLSSGGQTASGTSSPIVVTGLTNGVSYTFQVFATNSYGPSAFSATSGSATPEPSGNLYSFGTNNYGQMGDGTVNPKSSPVQVGALTTWKTVSIYSNSSMATKSDGTLWTWGQNDYGQLGQNNKVYRSSPTQVGALTNWLNVSCGGDTMAAIKTDGTLWTWGNNSNGQLGLSDANSRSSPVQVGALTNWSYVSISSSRLTVLKTDGTLWAAGAINMLGGIGSKSSPTQIGADTWSYANSGHGNIGLIKSNGTLWLTGSNTYGQLGLNNTTYYSSPKQVGALTTWSKISFNRSSGEASAAGVKTDGTLWTWGSATVGRLGNNTNSGGVSSPVQIGALTNWQNVAIGSNASISVKTDGTLWVWGQGSEGQLGGGNLVSRSSPVQVGSKTTWIDASSGSNFSAAIAS